MDQLAKEIETKVRTKKPISIDDYIYLLKNNKNAFWAFLISNNPANINNTLRHGLIKPYTELGFFPDVKALTRTIEMMLQKNEEGELTEVLSNFELNPKGLDQDFILKFTQEFSQ